MLDESLATALDTELGIKGKRREIPPTVRSPSSGNIHLFTTLQLSLKLPMSQRAFSVQVNRIGTVVQDARSCNYPTRFPPWRKTLHSSDTQNTITSKDVKQDVKGIFLVYFPHPKADGTLIGSCIFGQSKISPSHFSAAITVAVDNSFFR